jgi:hypothetical protein
MIQLSIPVLSQFSAPTCQLEIKAKRSPLSTWLGNTVLKNVRFRLRLQDSSGSQDSILIRGNREQLESLRIAVETYIQDFLTSSTETLPPDFLAEPIPEPEINAPEDAVILFPKVELTDDKDSSVPSGVPQLSSELSENQLPAQPIVRSHNFSHELFLGDLASETTGASLTLSFLQLRDLATVFSYYHNEVMALPDSTQTSSSLPKNPVVLFGSAAAILVAVGITTYAIRIGQSPSEVEGQLASIDAEGDNLEFADPSLIEVPPLELPDENIQFPNPTAPPGLETIPSPDQTSILAPSEPSESGSAMPSPSLLQKPQLPNRNPQQQAQSPRSSASLPVPPPTGLALPSLSSPAAPPSLPTIPSSPIPSPPSVRTPPPQTPPEIPGNAPSLPDYSPPPEAVQDLYGIATAPNAASSIPRASAPAEREGLRDLVESQTETAAVNLPQVAEIQRYFEQRWQPPANLDEPIEYILYLSQEGSLERIIPVGETSKTYIDQTNIPLLDEPFVSKFDRQGTPQVRVVFKPNGEVETFLEQAN